MQGEQNRVVESRAARGNARRQGHAKLAKVGRERNAVGETAGDAVAKIHHEHFIVPIAGPNERHRRRDYVSVLRAHASAGVDHQANRDRDIFARKLCDLLELAVLIDSEVILAQIRDVLARGVLDAHIQQDEFGGGAELERLLGGLDGGDLRRECPRDDRQPEDKNVSKHRNSPRAVARMKGPRPIAGPKI